MAAGDPVDYTYDQHRTKLGHRVMADVIAPRLGAESPGG